MKYELIENLAVSPNLIEQILLNRGIAQQDIIQYLNPNDKLLLDPLLLDNITKGAELLLKHITQGSKIHIVVDSDLDGYSSAAALINYLGFLFPKFVENNITYNMHEGKQHGIILDEIPSGTQLIIAPDSSSSDFDIHKQLQDEGVEILVLDHHSAPEVSKYACVINNQLCDYPNKTLSGVGIVYKFCCYLDTLMNKSYADEIVDLAAVGIIADVMLINNLETRAIIFKGLQKFKNPLLNAMVEKDSFHFGGKLLSPFLVSWYIAPQINAITRSGTLQEKQVVFEAMLNHLAYQKIPSTKRGCAGQMELRIEQAVRTCTNVKNRQTREKDAATEIIQNIIQKENLNKNKILAIRLSPEYATNTNLTGLICNQLLSNYGKPVLLLNKTEDENGNVVWAGSGRGARAFREEVECSGLALYSQGHSGAFGTAILDENFEKLIDYFNNLYQEIQEENIYKVDYIFQGNDFSSNQILQVANYNHIWGFGCEQPLFAFERISVTPNNIALLSPDRNPTLKITLPNGVSCIKFKSSQEEYDSLTSAPSGNIVFNLIGKCELNEWQGIINPQIFIEDYEVLEINKYYF